MNETINPDTTLNELVSAHPGALPILHEFGLDTCCGGALPLREAVTRHGLKLDELLSRLDEAR